MKKILLTLCVAFASIAMYAAGLEGARIYVNPGHGSWGPNDRPNPTIPFPNLSSTGMPDTLGFYESNTNLWKCEELTKKLREAGATVVMSRTQSGPWPYQMVDGQYPDYSWAAYQQVPDFEKYNKALNEIAAEVESGNYDYMVSVHSNAASTNPDLVNYLYLAVRGDGAYGEQGQANAHVAACWERAKVAWPYVFTAMGSELEVHGHNYTATNPNIRTQTLGVLRHSVPSWLSEGYFHTYEPSRHRALNPDYCREEGLRYYRGIAAWFEQAPENKGYILGAVKDLHEKMDDSLYMYRPKTHDQFVPLNGATVTLYKAGVKVADYKVDNFYNGLFFFRDLEPGDDYTLEFTCEGYKDLFEEKAYTDLLPNQPELLLYHKGMNLTVKANETTYPVALLESESYTPPPVNYVDYPDPVQPSYAVLPGALNMKQQETKTYTIEGTIKRTIAVGDSTIVLSHTEDKVAHLYLIDHLAGTIAPITTDGILPLDTENLGAHYALSDVALTCDGFLIGINEIVCQYSATEVDAGYKRGEIQLYKWESLDAATVQPWMVIPGQPSLSGNYYRAVTGQTLTVCGTKSEYVITTTARTASGTSIRIPTITITDDVLTAVSYTKPSGCSSTTQGEKYTLTLSPRDPANSVILDGELSGATELKGATTVGTGSVDLVGAWPTEMNFFKYAGKSVMVSPYVNEDNKVAGVRLFDVTAGLDKAVEIKTTNTDLAEPIETKFAAATAKVSGVDVTIYLVTDGGVTTFTTKGEVQPVAEAVFAYDLDVALGIHGYQFSFKTNATAVSGSLVFYKEDAEVARVALASIVEGENIVTIPAAEIPGEDLTWAIDLQGVACNAVGEVYADNTSYKKAYHAINTFPESDYFGHIYVMNNNAAESGVDVYDASLTKLNEAPYTGGQTWANPARLSVGADGKVYFSDWAAAHAGVFVANPAQMDGTYAAVFEGTVGSDGLIKNGGTAVASHTPTVYAMGSGADAKLFIYNAVAVGSAAVKSVLQYNIGEAATWGAAPSKAYTLKGNANGEGNIRATSRGFWLSTNRAAANGNSNYSRSLQFYDYDGTNQFSSGNDEFPQLIQGSANSAYAVSDDESLLVINNALNEFVFFDITWVDNTPTLTLSHKYEHGLTGISQMNFDYAGNIVASGTSGLYVFAIPNENHAITPAKKALTVSKKEVTLAVAEVTLNHSTYTLIEEETLALVATVLPAEVIDVVLTWESSDETIATVADGLVTAVAPGQATITVSAINAAMTEAITATCEIVVQVDPATGELTIETVGIYYSMETIHNPQGLALQVYNLNGQLVATGNGDINMSDAAMGVYIVRSNAGVLKFFK